MAKYAETTSEPASVASEEDKPQLEVYNRIYGKARRATAALVNQSKQTQLLLDVSAKSDHATFIVTSRHGADVNVKNDKRQTPIHIAVQNDNKEMASCCLLWGK